MRAFAARSIALVGGFSAVVAAAAPARTQIVVYSPFTPDNTLAGGLRITQTAAGYCWIGSESEQRSDAWRCAIGNEILDPCFAGPVAWVACPSGKGVIRINLNKPLPLKRENRPLDTSTADPASMVIEVNGRKIDCGFEGGATGAIAGLRLNCMCSNGAWLVGSPNRRTPIWHILCLPSLKATNARSVSILVARW